MLNDIKNLEDSISLISALQEIIFEELRGRKMLSADYNGYHLLWSAKNHLKQRLSVLRFEAILRR